jgi:hypothetical protein
VFQKCSDSLVGIATGYGLDGPFSIPGSVSFFLSTASRLALDPAQPPIQWVPAAPSPRLKRLGREADHSLHVVSRSKKVELYLYSLICPHGIVKKKVKLSL